MLQPHIKCKFGDISKYVVLPGDPGRIDVIASHLENVKEVAYNREFRIINGKYKGIDISAVSTGIGGPSASIAVEELTNVGAEYFIRVGTCGGLRKGMKSGDIIIPYASTRSEGTTLEYLPLEFPAVADAEVYTTIVNATKKLNIKSYVGVNRSHDAFYENIGNFKKWSSVLHDKRYDEKSFPLISSEMECSAVFLVSMLRNVKAGAVLAVNTVEPIIDSVEDLDIYSLDESKNAADGVDNTTIIALESFYNIDKGLR